jgi:hypothetical protein
MNPQEELFHSFLADKYKKMLELYPESERIYPNIISGNT